MANQQTRLHQLNIKKMMQSDEMAASLKARADRIAAAAGPGMEADVRVGRTRARASVITATSEARYAEATGRKLTQAIDAGRG
jgi:tRNA A37 threonylcarbamoyltransferase TsaD